MTITNNLIANTGSRYVTYNVDGIRVKVRFSDHDSNAVLQDADIELPVEKYGSQDVENLVKTCAEAKKETQTILSRTKINYNVLGYRQIERTGGYVTVKFTAEKKYNMGTIKALCGNDQEKIDAFISSCHGTIEKGGNTMYLKDGIKEQTMAARDFHRIHSNVVFI